ncbi:MAG: ribbon-helix-helix domain-containing protein [Coriobacteriia bacterium]|nr:ribbon-helix-helix domain-containing protein [Coriobacteriia bacterium]
MASIDELKEKHEEFNMRPTIRPRYDENERLKAIALRVPERLLEPIDERIKELGFKNKSEYIRALIMVDIDWKKRDTNC